jgi:acetyltransferase-like isoleucine patch superfamily enzyme
LGSAPRRLGFVARGAAVSPDVLIESGVRTTGRVSRISIGPQTVLERRCRLTVSMSPASPEARLRIGARVLIGEGTYVTAHHDLEIGDDVLIAAGCYITEANHGVEPGELIRDQATVTGRVSIGRGAWLGAHAVVLPGVRIGEGAVVGAGSVVKTDVPDNAIVAGIPARLIRHR